MKIKNTFWLLVGWMALAILTNACTEKEDIRTGKGIPVEVVCHLQLASIEGDLSTRGGALDTEESTIENLTVIQFDGAEESAPAMIVRTFQNPSDALTVGLMQPPSAEKEQTLYFIANAGETFADFSGTLGAFKAATIPASEMGGHLLMTGSCQTKIKTEIPVTAKLTSRLAKIVFEMDVTNLPDGSRFEPLWLQLRSVPIAACPEARGTTYPDANKDLYADLEPVVSDIDKGYTWYIPENRRGGGNATEAKDKNNHTPDGYCTFIYLEANYYPDADKDEGAKRVYYTLYPGADNRADFNVEGNRAYNVKLTIKEIKENMGDSRLKVEAIPASLPGANCYMVQPNSFLTFSPHNPPGADVADIGIVYLDRVGTKDKCKIDHAGIVWQTDPGLIRAIYHLSASGEYRIQTGDMKGNALIAAYNADNKILWSWHIWVTDYVLDNVSDNMTGNSAAATTGGNVYKWDGYIWMDRGIGANSATVGMQSLGMIFQWGRKDPFTSANELKTTQNVMNDCIPIYDAEGNRIYPSGNQYTKIENVFDEAMTNPTVFYSKKDLYHWFGSTSDLPLWKYPEKTCFDPCPAGWCIPPSAAIDKVSTYTTLVYSTDASKIANNRVYVKNLEGLFWPYIGFRDQNNGFGAGAGHSGIYWTTDYLSSQRIRIYGGYFGGYNGSNQTVNTYRYTRDGLGGRCVKIQ